MAEGTRHKLTPVEYAVDFNRGAVYAKRTGNLIEGMEFVFNDNELERESIIQEVLTGAKSYINSHNEYSKKIEGWKASDDKTEENKPKLDQSSQFALAEVNYGQLARSMDTRTKIFEDNWKQLSLKQAMGISQYRNIPRSISGAIVELVNSNGGMIKDIKSEKAKNIANAFGQYHILGNTARDIQGMYLARSLEAIAGNPED